MRVERKLREGEGERREERREKSVEWRETGSRLRGVRAKDER